ncbi:NAD-dependent epimerase/dehydratase family protein [Candidatus Woesearchaeota archaeon]|nr:NAD-dependent epimerase/dehydratase family protein [Candidatus Woesearchaeota archaeon]
MKKILVTGGTGLIGKKVVELLSKKNKVFVITRTQTSVNKNGIMYINADLSNAEAIKLAVSGKDIIVHIGGVIKDSRKNIFRTNIEGTKNIVNACIKNNVKRIVFISSDAVFQGHKNIYSESKRIGELEIKKIKDNCILRSTIVYGKENKTNLGKVIELIKNYPAITIPGKGNNKIQPIHVNDVAKYISIAVEKNIQGTYILAGGEVITFNEFIDEVCKFLGIKRLKIHIPIFLVLPLAKLLEIISPQFGINVSQIKNLNLDKVYDILKTIKVFKHKPINIKDGLKLTLS